MEFKGYARDIINKKNIIYEKILAIDNSNIINLSHLSYWESNTEKASEYFLSSSGFSAGSLPLSGPIWSCSSTATGETNLLKHTHPYKLMALELRATQASGAKDTNCFYHLV